MLVLKASRYIRKRIASQMVSAEEVPPTAFLCFYQRERKRTTVCRVDRSLVVGPREMAKL